jgi:hypothetical protein
LPSPRGGRLRRAGFPRVVEAGRQLVDVLRAVSAGGGTVDMSDALLRESIDVIGALAGPLQPSHPRALRPGGAHRPIGRRQAHAQGRHARSTGKAPLLWAPVLVQHW